MSFLPTTTFGTNSVQNACFLSILIGEAWRKAELKAEQKAEQKDVLRLPEIY